MNTLLLILFSFGELVFMLVLLAILRAARNAPKCKRCGKALDGATAYCYECFLKNVADDMERLREQDDEPDQRKEICKPSKAKTEKLHTQSHQTEHESESAHSDHGGVNQSDEKSSRNAARTEPDFEEDEEPRRSELKYFVQGYR